MFTNFCFDHLSRGRRRRYMDDQYDPRPKRSRGMHTVCLSLFLRCKIRPSSQDCTLKCCHHVKSTCLLIERTFPLGPAMYMSNLYKEVRRERSPVRFPVPRDSRSFNGVQNYTDFMRELHSRGAPPLTAMPYPPPVSKPLILCHYSDYSMKLCSGFIYSAHLLS
jgi:hypothetical protein